MGKRIALTKEPRLKNVNPINHSHTCDNHRNFNMYSSEIFSFFSSSVIWSSAIDGEGIVKARYRSARASNQEEEKSKSINQSDWNIRSFNIQKVWECNQCVVASDGASTDCFTDRFARFSADTFKAYTEISHSLYATLRDTTSRAFNLRCSLSTVFVTRPHKYLHKIANCKAAFFHTQSFMQFSFFRKQILVAWHFARAVVIKIE